LLDVYDVFGPCPSFRPSRVCFAQEIQAHAWFMQGLEPGALNFNDAIVQESLANQPTAEMLAEV
jgi:serine/threonine-protein kinase SRK2